MLSTNESILKKSFQDVKFLLFIGSSSIYQYFITFHLNISKLNHNETAKMNQLKNTYRSAYQIS